MKRIINISVCVLLCLSVQAQTVTYDGFMKAVAEKNVSYLAEKYNVDAAVANVQAAKVFNDPELSVTYTNNQDWKLQMGQSVDVGLSYSLDLVGVRKNRIRVAKTEKEMTEASVAAFLASLRLEASRAWAEAWKLRESCRMMKESVDDMMQIANSDSMRLSVGDIGRIDATQSRLEAKTLKGELCLMEAEYRNALMTLGTLCGGEKFSDMEEGDLRFREIGYSADAIMNMAEASRADLKAAELGKTLSENNLKLVKATRSFEMGLSLGYSYSNTVYNVVAPAPSFNSVSVGVSIPLKFSSFNKGELNAARSQVAQSQRYYEAACLQVRTEAAQAYNSFLASCTVMEKYDTSILGEAREIAEARKEGYLKGESSLVELLSAQQTFRDVMQGYIDACANRYSCLAALEQATGAAW